MLLFSITFAGVAGVAVAADGNYYIGSHSGVDLRLAPRNSATVSGHLDRKTKVEVIDTRRSWTKVQTLGSRSIKGWVPAGAVRKSYSSATSSRSSSSFFSSFTSLFRSPEPPRKTAVLGVRGLEDDSAASAEKTATEQANKAVEWMETLNVPDEAVAAFINEGDLNP